MGRTDSELVLDGDDVTVPTEVFVSVAQQEDGAWLCYWSEQPAGVEGHAARRTRERAFAWAREQLGLKRIVWDTATGTYFAKTKVDE